MDGVSSGNAAKVSRKGWFVGHFIKDDLVRQSKDVCVKWGIHNQGASNKKFTAYRSATTISVLIHGKFRLTCQSRHSGCSSIAQPTRFWTGTSRS
jgi:hypothetical protein